MAAIAPTFRSPSCFSFSLGNPGRSFTAKAMDEAISRLVALDRFLFPSSASSDSSSPFPSDFSLPDLVTSTTNDFFSLFTDDAGASSIGLNGDGGLWARLPNEWRESFVQKQETFGDHEDQAEEFLKTLASSDENVRLS